jgi:hypothetical protein
LNINVVVQKLDLEVYSVDVVEYFLHKEEKKIEDRDEMINWARRQTIKAGFSLIIGKSDSVSEHRKPKLVLSCEKSGEY